MTIHRALLASLVLALAAFLAGSPLPAAAQSSVLTGELFNDVGEWATSPDECDPAETQTFTIDVQGDATGPYNGTFTETGTVILGPGTGARPILAFNVDFTITSTIPPGSVTGSKQAFFPAGEELSAICETVAEGSNVTFAGIPICYNATLPDGTTDIGVATGIEIGAGEPGEGAFMESFLSNSEGGVVDHPCADGGEGDDDDDDDDGDDDGDDDDDGGDDDDDDDE